MSRTPKGVPDTALDSIVYMYILRTLDEGTRTTTNTHAARIIARLRASSKWWAGGHGGIAEAAAAAARRVQMRSVSRGESSVCLQTRQRGKNMTRACVSSDACVCAGGGLGVVGARRLFGNRVGRFFVCVISNVLGELFFFLALESWVRGYVIMGVSISIM